jgi:hypothetical protein
VRYHVTTEDGHSLLIAPNSEGAFEASALKVDLSQATLITDPSKDTEGIQLHSELLHPLGARARYAFERLSELEPERVSSSTLLKALVEFKEHRLPQLLDEISIPCPSPAIDRATFEKLSREPRRAELLLSRIVREVDSTLPGYLRTERETGILKWLESGGSCPTEYSVGKELLLSPSVVKDAQHLVTDVSGTRVLFDLKTQTTHVGSVSNPTTQTVLSSLCTSGTLGQEIVELNRAALLSIATTQLRHLMEVREAGNPAAHMRNFLTKEAYIGLRTRFIRCLFGATFVTTIAAQTLLHLSRGSVSGFDVMAAALATYVGQRTARLFGEYRAIKRVLRDAAAEVAEKLQELKSAGGVTILRMLPASIIDHVARMSGGRQHTTFGERSQADWNASLPKLAVSDTNIFRSNRVTVAPNLELEHLEPLRMGYAEVEDFSDLRCDETKIGELALPELLRATHIERGAAAWNTLHALTLIRDFTETQRIPTPETLWFDHREVLEKKSDAKINDKGAYPEIAAAFARVTSHFHISRPTWNHISLALQAASTLERVSQTRKAQAIAAEAVRKESLLHE